MHPSLLLSSVDNVSRQVPVNKKRARSPASTADVVEEKEPPPKRPARESRNKLKKKSSSRTGFEALDQACEYEDEEERRGAV
jgi:hypothetical protein